MIAPKFKLITKEVIGIPWDSEVKYNLFRALIVFEDEEIDPNTIWRQSEQEAISESLNWLRREWKKNPKIEKTYEGVPYPARGRRGYLGYVGYYVLKPS